MTDTERIKKICKYLIYQDFAENDTEIAEKLGYTKSSFQQIINGKVSISQKFIEKLVSANENINKIWIKTGQGTMLKSEEKESEKEESDQKEITGYYYPNVQASAGMDTEMINDELDRIPISLPNWEKDIAFINVYGDSMYPKFCSGEIIGIKEVQPQYINFGYAYVVILNDGQVFLKYIKKGKEEEHWILASENPKYESMEYHISLIRKIHIIKGVITKTTI